MENKFNSSEYINHLANELIRNFSYSGAATTPVLVGSAREKEVMRKLELLLPKFVGIGSGCVIDSYGNTSKQLDIILYEKDFCPVFCINESAETTYFPCEGVIAVGEVKSTLNTKELKDIFKKIESVKKLKRFSSPSKSQLRNENHFSFRSYGTKMSMEGAKSEDFDQENKITDQIIGFALCGNLGIKKSTLSEKYIELMNIYPNNRQLNMTAILNHGIITYLNASNNKIEFDSNKADTLFISDKRENNFEFLLKNLNVVISTYRTVDTNAFNRYISSGSSLSLFGATLKKYKNS